MIVIEVEAYCHLFLYLSLDVLNSKVYYMGCGHNYIIMIIRTLITFRKPRGHNYIVMLLNITIQTNVIFKVK